jgi:hypothetical protein
MEILEIKIELPCTPKRLVVGEWNDDSIVLQDVTYREMADGPHIRGPWWPQGAGAPMSVFKASAAQHVDLAFLLPKLFPGMYLALHLFNQNVSARSFQGVVEAIPGHEASSHVAARTPGGRAP